MIFETKIFDRGLKRFLLAFQSGGPASKQSEILSISDSHAFRKTSKSYRSDGNKQLDKHL
jgi:hypothetical protein